MKALPPSALEAQPFLGEVAVPTDHPVAETADILSSISSTYLALGHIIHPLYPDR